MKLSALFAVGLVTGASLCFLALSRYSLTPAPGALPIVYRLDRLTGQVWVVDNSTGQTTSRLQWAPVSNLPANSASRLLAP